MATPGDPCAFANCAGHLIVYDSHVVGETRVRYLWCSEKKAAHIPDDNKQLVPLKYAPVRRNLQRLQQRRRERS